jgi:tRNA (uracil-5-)-methyltransferase TRM9
MDFEISPDKKVFDRMAAGWYNFRHYSIFRSELDEMAKRWKQNGRLLNVGCGHGADFLPLKDNFQLYGVDFSIEMLKQARRYAGKFNFSAELIAADAAQLPFDNESFDYAIAVAAYHHIKGKGQQLAALRELKRVLKPNAEAFLTVWNRWQRRFFRKGKEVAVPWKAEGQIIHRYYYLFTYLEFESLVKKAGFKLLKSFPETNYHLPVRYFSRNICVLVKNES